MQSIPFQDKMVRAILSGRKCVTRRLTTQGCDALTNDNLPTFRDRSQVIPEKLFKYKAGQLRYVRETWGVMKECHPATPSQVTINCVAYRATDSGNEVHRWCPGMFMPERISRLRIDIVSVTCELFRGSISHEEAKFEGFESPGEFLDLWNTIHPGEIHEPQVVYRIYFRALSRFVDDSGHDTWVPISQATS